MKRFLLLIALPSALPLMCSAQQPVHLSLGQAITMATSPKGSASVLLADAAAQAAGARVAYAHSLLFPLIEGSVSETNLTRNLSAEGFNFSTGIPNFTIPAEVGPFNVFDARISATQNIFNLGAIRRSRGLRAGLDAAVADVNLQREHAAAQVAHDYLLALRADASSEAANTDVSQSESLVKLAEDRVHAGKAADLELTRAKLSVLANHRRLTAAQSDRQQAQLQLLGDLGLSYSTQLEFADHLSFAAEEVPEADTAIATAFASRPELLANQKREEEAHDNDIAIRDEWLPVVTGYGDVGPQGNVITHTVGISAKVTVFDGGRRSAERAESAAVVRQSVIQQNDLRRKIELEVRRALVALQAASAQVTDCRQAQSLADDDLAAARRRFDAGITGNAELVDAQSRNEQARNDLIGALFSWNQARVDLAQATGTASMLSLK